MSLPLIECVPNFSEGTRGDVLGALAASIREVPGVRLLDVSADPDHNRSVFTLVGWAEAVFEAAYRSAAIALQRIDLRVHRGVHPRIGAVDVIPFVPLRDATMEACAAVARRLAARLAADFELPAYLYGAASTSEGRTLATIRRGGFESLRTEIARPTRHPDYGPARVHSTAGAVAVGARAILIAFNVDLACTDLAVARAIATIMRESSGGLPAVQAMGVPLASRRLVQVSMNLLDYRRTSPRLAYERVAAEAARRGIGVSAGELVGCAPRDALPADPVTALHLRRLRPEQILDPEEIARAFSDADDSTAGAAGRP